MDSDDSQQAGDAGSRSERESPPAAPRELSLDELSEVFAEALGKPPAKRRGRGAQGAQDPADPAAAGARPADPASPSPSPSAEAAAASDAPQDGLQAGLPDALEPGDFVGVTPQAIVEAMLFVGHPQDEPLPARYLASLLRGVEPAEVEHWVRELNDQYAAHGAPYQIASVGKGFRMQLRREHGPMRDRFLGRVAAARLSEAAIEVLALVAYQQPTTREELDRLRGSSSGGIIAQLLRRGLLRLEREAKEPPRYFTTDRFLEVFHLDSLDDLPRDPDF